ncbi:hypothetical protein [Williamsia muralis]|uniref:Uncharacterized protein n=1 Tax=Williamsia marianensis TaxID=85044 RepID=A0ABU4F0R4_WILMA|nr:hypothetical protein [Williamsia muralis]MDV7137100.1 hypothetical protein [Williamsia muralis]
MSSSTAIDFESIEAQVRAEAERKVTVLREIMDTHKTLTHERDAFLAADSERLRTLNTLLTEAKAAGFDHKTLKPFDVDPLATAKAANPRRARRTTRPASVANSDRSELPGHASEPAPVGSAGTGE